MSSKEAHWLKIRMEMSGYLNVCQQKCLRLAVKVKIWKHAVFILISYKETVWVETNILIS